jgi:hypothetical protein
VNNKFKGKGKTKDIEDISNTNSPDIELVKRDLQHTKLFMHPTGEFINASSHVMKEINLFNQK